MRAGRQRHARVAEESNLSAIAPAGAAAAALALHGLDEGDTRGIAALALVRSLGLHPGGNDASHKCVCTAAWSSCCCARCAGGVCSCSAKRAPVRLLCHGLARFAYTGSRPRLPPPAPHFPSLALKRFAGDYVTKGLFTYASGQHKGRAFWGRGGTFEEETLPLHPHRKHRMRIAEVDPTLLAAIKVGRVRPRTVRRGASIGPSTSTGVQHHESLKLSRKATPHHTSALKHHMSESDLLSQTRDLDGASVGDHTPLDSRVTANPLASRRSAALSAPSTATEISPHLPEGPPRRRNPRRKCRTPQQRRSEAEDSGGAVHVTPQMKRNARARKESERAKVSAQKRANRRAKAEALLARRKARAARGSA